MGALMFMAIAVVARKRSDLDPEILARQKEYRLQRQRIEKGESLKDLSDAVRRMAAMATSVPRQEIDIFLAECDAQVFAPGGESLKLDQSLQEKALSLADKMAPTTRGATL